MCVTGVCVAVGTGVADGAASVAAVPVGVTVRVDAGGIVAVGGVAVSQAATINARKRTVKSEGTVKGRFIIEDAGS